MRENPKPFEVYRHFKGSLYQILTLAEHSEDGRTMVVYQALYGEYKVYVRSLDMFMSLTDTEKYPEVSQRYRFEKVEAGAADRSDSKVRPDVKTTDETQVLSQVRPDMQPDRTPEDSQAQDNMQHNVSRIDLQASSDAHPDWSPADTTANADVEADPAADPGEDTLDLDPAVLEFLDAETYQQKLNILASMKHRITDEMINTLAIASDLEVEPGPVEKRYDSLKNCLLMKDRFEKVRLL